MIVGCGVAIGYLLYWFFSAVAGCVPLPLKIAIAAVAMGLILLLVSITRERLKAAKEEDFKGVDK